MKFSSFPKYYTLKSYWIRNLILKNYTEIENSQNLKIFSRLVNFKECALFEEIGHFQGFRVFDFGPCTEIKNSENSEILSRLENFRECALFE